MEFLRNDKTAFANEIEKKYKEKLASTAAALDQG
jgi:hypothetical protein